MYLKIRPFGGAWRRQNILGLSSAGTSIMDYQYTRGIAVAPKTDILVECGYASASVDVCAGFDIVQE